VENALDSVVNITGKTENLDNSRGRVVDVVQNLSAIAQQNAASSEETSASVVEVGNIVVDISSNAAHLKEIAYGLDQSVKKFQL
jgi:methyl-accepting chemotaxis protein